MSTAQRQPGIAGPPRPIERVLQNENGVGAEVLHAIDRRVSRNGTKHGLSRGPEPIPLSRVLTVIDFVCDAVQQDSDLLSTGNPLVNREKSLWSACTQLMPPWCTGPLMVREKISLNADQAGSTSAKLT